MPSVRSRLVTAKYRSNLRMSAPIVDSAVAWYTTTSGRAAIIADSVATASRTSMTSGSAPAAASPPAFEAVVVVAVTSWPAPTSIGSSCRPTTPVAPMTKIRILVLLTMARSLRFTATVGTTTVAAIPRRYYPRWEFDRCPARRLPSFGEVVASDPSPGCVRGGTIRGEHRRPGCEAGDHGVRGARDVGAGERRPGAGRVVGVQAARAAATTRLGVASSLGGAPAIGHDARAHPGLWPRRVRQVEPVGRLGTRRGTGRRLALARRG